MPTVAPGAAPIMAAFLAVPLKAGGDMRLGKPDGVFPAAGTLAES